MTHFSPTTNFNNYQYICNFIPYSICFIDLNTNGFQNLFGKLELTKRATKTSMVSW